MSLNSQLNTLVSIVMNTVRTHRPTGEEVPKLRIEHSCPDHDEWSIRIHAPTSEETIWCIEKVIIIDVICLVILAGDLR